MTGKDKEKNDQNRGKKFRQLYHRITEPYHDQDQPTLAGEFQGKFLIR